MFVFFSFPFHFFFFLSHFFSILGIRKDWFIELLKIYRKKLESPATLLIKHAGSLIISEGASSRGEKSIRSNRRVLKGFCLYALWQSSHLDGQKPNVFLIAFLRLLAFTAWLSRPLFPSLIFCLIHYLCRRQPVSWRSPPYVGSQWACHGFLCKRNSWIYMPWRSAKFKVLPPGIRKLYRYWKPLLPSTSNSEHLKQTKARFYPNQWAYIFLGSSWHLSPRFGAKYGWFFATRGKASLPSPSPKKVVACSLRFALNYSKQKENFC